jgi:hypothetical protein
VPAPNGLLCATDEGRGGVSQQESVWTLVLGIAVFWVLISASAATVSVRYEMRRRAWGWMESFLVSSLVAAYSFWRLP